MGLGCPQKATYDRTMNCKHRESQSYSFKASADAVLLQREAELRGRPRDVCRSSLSTILFVQIDDGSIVLCAAISVPCDVSLPVTFSLHVAVQPHVTNRAAVLTRVISHHQPTANGTAEAI